VVVEQKVSVMCVDEPRDALRRRVTNVPDVIAEPLDSAEHHAIRQNAASNKRASRRRVRRMAPRMTAGGVV
jgi:hypothetical protein